MISNFAIRPFAPADQSAVRKLVLEGLGEHFGFIDEQANPDLDDIVRNYIQPGYTFIVVDSGNGLIGSGALIPVNDPTTKTAQMVRVSVHSDYRRQGIGAMIVNFLVNTACQQNYQRVIIETTTGWQAAIGLYQSCRFTEYASDEAHVYLALALACASKE